MPGRWHGCLPEPSPVEESAGVSPPQVNTSFDAWKTTKWKDINVEQMDIDCKKFAKDVRSLDKEMKSWDAFVGLDNTVKNMITSLRAVSELQNPAIRDRHWQQLMQATQVPHWRRGGGQLSSGTRCGSGGLTLAKLASRVRTPGHHTGLQAQVAPSGVRGSAVTILISLINTFFTRDSIIFILYQALQITQPALLVA